MEVENIINEYPQALASGRTSLNLEMYVAGSLYSAGATRTYSEAIQTYRLEWWLDAEGQKGRRDDFYLNIMRQIQNINALKQLFKQYKHL